MEFIRKLPNADEVRESFALTNQQRLKRQQIITEIESILSGKSRKKLICIGPCSADDEKAVLVYMNKLAVLSEKVSSCFLIIPRIYTSKPRTNGMGYKGLIHRPVISSSNDNIYNGILAIRKMHLHIIQETGMFGADEMLYPEAIYYISDLLAYAAVGARSVENQQHRLVSSGLNIPIGMKNPTSGDIDVMLNAILAAQSPQNYMYHGWECRSNGNPYSHAILRGYTTIERNIHPNYHYEDLCDIHDQYQKKGLKNISVIVDCNHNNSRKHYDEQIRISKEVFSICKEFSGINRFVKGLMIESYLEDGCQMIGSGVFGKSITDPCIGWNKTEKLIFELAEIIDSKGY